uniref:Pepdidase_M14_N domain-containing protein n=1 Tax=Mesocestoides corti TaxID=53468 RepID=A0A5K3EP33_MESCO
MRPAAMGVRYNSMTVQQILSTFMVLMKWRRNISRATSAGAVTVLLDLFLDLHRCDHKGRFVDLQLLSLACLQTLTEFRSGRKAILTAGGAFALFAVCAGYVGPNPNLIVQLHHNSSYSLPLASQTVADKAEPLPSVASLQSTRNSSQRSQTLKKHKNQSECSSSSSSSTKQQDN